MYYTAGKVRNSSMHHSSSRMEVNPLAVNPEFRSRLKAARSLATLRSMPALVGVVGTDASTLPSYALHFNSCSSTAGLRERHAIEVLYTSSFGSCCGTFSPLLVGEHPIRI